MQLSKDKIWRLKINVGRKAISGFDEWERMTKLKL